MPRTVSVAIIVASLLAVVTILLGGCATQQAPGNWKVYVERAQALSEPAPNGGE